ncbi:MAG: hypothetical protein ACOY37_08110 [Pseudomonadota bacterium]
MADTFPADSIRPLGTRLLVDVYRRHDGRLLIRAAPSGDVPADCVHVGCALLDHARWRRRLGGAWQPAQAVLVPWEFGAELVAELQLIG